MSKVKTFQQIESNHEKMFLSGFFELFYGFPDLQINENCCVFSIFGRSYSCILSCMVQTSPPKSEKYLESVPISVLQLHECIGVSNIPNE